MLKGYKTYIGLLITLLGVLGYGQIISEGEAVNAVNLITELVGIALAIYGRAVAKV